MRVERLECELGSSRSLWVVVMFGHLGACVLLCSPLIGSISLISMLLRLLGILFLGLNLRHVVRTHLFRSTPRSVVKFWQDVDGRFGCQFKMGQSAYGTLKGDSFHTVGLMILRLRISNRVVNVIICRDSLPRETYRILSCRLKQL